MLRSTATCSISKLAQWEWQRPKDCLTILSVHTTEPTMATQQQLLQQARDVMVCGADAHRHSLKTAAMAHGRTVQQVTKASTMRLALWVSKGTSAI